SEVSEIIKVYPKIDENKRMYFEFIIACEKEENLKFLQDLKINFYLLKEKIVSKEEKKEKPSITSQTTSYIRVDLSKLDELMRILGELVIARSRLQENLREIEKYLPLHIYRNLSETNRSLERHLRELRESLMRVRLIPIGESFERMQFVIRDLIRESNKKINLHISGKETEIDKYIVERIVEPLLHLVRNAISHGIEGEEERIKKGKDPTGNIYLRAYTSGEEVVIEVENDGRPIDTEKVAEKALKLGLIKDKSEVTSEEKILDIICSPDFSTKEEADRASGRGVGMAVVRNTVKELGGKLSLKSDEKSTCFTLRLPLTLAILDTIIVEVSSERYAIPQSSIREIIEIKKEDIIEFRGMKIISHRDKSIPLVFLSDVFKLSKNNKNKYFVLLVIKENKEWGIIVDKVINIREAVIRPINDPIILENPAISGATDFGDGKVVLILNVDGLLRREVREGV
ncbi:MAG: chemotaxis protein CheW, partial [Dictyoglomaceae bacterium]